MIHTTFIPAILKYGVYHKTYAMLKNMDSLKVWSCLYKNISFEDK